MMVVNRTEYFFLLSDFPLVILSNSATQLSRISWYACVSPELRATETGSVLHGGN